MNNDPNSIAGLQALTFDRPQAGVLTILSPWSGVVADKAPIAMTSTATTTDTPASATPLPLFDNCAPSGCIRTPQSGALLPSGLSSELAE